MSIVFLIDAVPMKWESISKPPRLIGFTAFDLNSAGRHFSHPLYLKATFIHGLYSNTLIQSQKTQVQTISEIEIHFSMQGW